MNNLSYDEKAKQVKDKLSQIDDITRHIVSVDWYNMHVDMDYKKVGKDVEIVEINYQPELYASPKHMTLAEFMLTPISNLINILEI